MQAPNFKFVNIDKRFATLLTLASRTISETNQPGWFEFVDDKFGRLSFIVAEAILCYYSRLQWEVGLHERKQGISKWIKSVPLFVSYYAGDSTRLIGDPSETQGICIPSESIRLVDKCIRVVKENCKFSFELDDIVSNACAFYCRINLFNSMKDGEFFFKCYDSDQFDWDPYFGFHYEDQNQNLFYSEMKRCLPEFRLLCQEEGDSSRDKAREYYLTGIGIFNF